MQARSSVRAAVARVTLLVLVLGALALPLAREIQAHNDRFHGTVTVYNNADRQFYASLDGRNMGYIQPGSYDTYHVDHEGDHTVYAQWDTGSAKKYCKTTHTYPDASVSFTSRDIY